MAGTPAAPNDLTRGNPVRRATLEVLASNLLKLKKLGVRSICSATEEGTMSLSHARWMCETAIEGLRKGEPLDKYSRWLGFVQAILVSQKVITVGTERDTTRRLFHEAYHKMGISVPESKGAATASTSN